MEQTMNAVLIQQVTLAEIERMINRAVESRMSDFYKKLQNKPVRLVGRQEAAAMINCSLPTIDKYAKCGILHAKHIGGRVYFREDELLSVKSR